MAGPEIPHPQSYRDYSARIRGWLYAWDFGRANAARYPQLVLPRPATHDRVVDGGGLLVFSWSAQVVRGDAGGVLSCAMYALDPNLRRPRQHPGHGRRLCDRGVLALRCWIGFCQTPTPRQALVASAMIALGGRIAARQRACCSGRYCRWCS